MSELYPFRNIDNAEVRHDMPVILNPLPEGCTCEFTLHRTISEKDFTLIPTQPDPECPVHLPDRGTLSEQS